MKLFVHIGVNKTGSSFIQTQITKGKEQLLSQGVFVPDSKWDSQMLNGRISPGNGSELAWNLSRKRSDRVLKMLKTYFRLGENNQAEKVLLSNETLIRVFSDKECLSIFESSAKKAGFSSVSCLSIFRNPINHALSLFKHRNKHGLTKYENYLDWLEKDYEFISLGEGFAVNIQNSLNSWHFELYSKNQVKLFYSFFKKWLRVELTLEGENTVVNSSLSLKEIGLITQLVKENPRIGKELYHSLIVMRGKLESSEELEKFKESFNIYVSQRKESLRSISSLMEESLRDKFEMENELVNPEADYSNCFTPSQVMAIVNSVQFVQTHKFKLEIKRLLYFILFIWRWARSEDEVNKKFGGSIQR